MTSRRRTFLNVTFNAIIDSSKLAFVRAMRVGTNCNRFYAVLLITIEKPKFLKNKMSNNFLKVLNRT